MKRLLCLILSIVICLSLFVACGKNEIVDDGETETSTATDVNGVVTDTITESATDEPTSSAQGTAKPTQSATSKPSASQQTSKPSASSTAAPTATNNSSTPTMPPITTSPTTIQFEAFGAVADGKTDNASKMKVALRNLKRYPKGSVLQLKSNATYYFGQKDSAIFIQGMSGYTIKGSNTTILIDAPAQYMTIANCEDITIQGLNFNYNTKPYAFTKSVDAVNTSKKTADVTLDRSLGITKRFTAPSVEFFGVVNRDDGRYHMSISKIEIIDAAKFKYRITFNNTFGDITGRLNLIKSNGMIVPMPNVGHSVEQAFTILSNKNLTMKDCNVWSTCKFSFFIRDNDGQVLFENFNVTPDPKENGGNIRIVGWRDGFHCKENHAKLIWKNCTLKWVYDDMFNISASMLKVDSVSGKTVILTWPEANGGSYPFIDKGDTISFYNVANGKKLGSAKISDVNGNTVTLAQSVNGVASGVYAVIDSLVAPGSELINCNIRGTIRFRGPITATNCNIHCTRMWLAFESANNQSGTSGLYLEGPVPEKISFKNCKFTFDSTSGKYVEIFAVGSTTASDSYHVNNVVFDGCSGISKNNIKLANGEASRNDVYVIK